MVAVRVSAAAAPVEQGPENMKIRCVGACWRICADIFDMGIWQESTGYTLDFVMVLHLAHVVFGILVRQSLVLVSLYLKVSTPQSLYYVHRIAAVRTTGGGVCVCQLPACRE